MATKKNDYSKDPTHGSPKAAGSKYQTRRAGTTTIRWAQVDGPTLKSAIDAITADGAAILFSRTSDGGALVAQVYDGPNKDKQFFKEPTDAVTQLQDWALAASGVDVS